MVQIFFYVVEFQVSLHFLSMEAIPYGDYIIASYSAPSDPLKPVTGLQCLLSYFVSYRCNVLCSYVGMITGALRTRERNYSYFSGAG